MVFLSKLKRNGSHSPIPNSLSRHLSWPSWSCFCVSCRHIFGPQLASVFFRAIGLSGLPFSPIPSAAFGLQQSLAAVTNQFQDAQRCLNLLDSCLVLFTIFIKRSWEAILPCYGQIELWDLKWWRVVRDWDLTLKGGVRLYDITIHHIETWPWWRVVWDFTWHNNTSHWDLTLMKGGVRLYMTVVTKGGGDDGKCWGREVVTKGRGYHGKWRGREVITKGSGDEGKWLRWEVARKGSDHEGKWWQREVATMGFVLRRKPEHETVCFSV